MLALTHQRAAIVAISRDVVLGMADEHQSAQTLDIGAGMAWSTPEEARARAEREKPMWQEAVRLSGARVE